MTKLNNEDLEPKAIEWAVANPQEPLAATTQISIAISLKRIADALSPSSMSWNIHDSLSGIHSNIGNRD